MSTGRGLRSPKPLHPAQPGESDRAELRLRKRGDDLPEELCPPDSRVRSTCGCLVLHQSVTPIGHPAISIPQRAQGTRFRSVQTNGEGAVSTAPTRACNSLTLKPYVYSNTQPSACYVGRPCTRHPAGGRCQRRNDAPRSAIPSRTAQSPRTARHLSDLEGDGAPNRSGFTG